jgi:tetratricopeptide (TPR) repeat protein
MVETVTFQRHLDHAQGYLMLKMYDEALAELDKVLESAPQHKDALYWKGLVHLEKGELRQAETPFLHLIALDRQHTSVYVHLAWIYRRTVSLEKAIETIQKALALNPRFPIALYNLACYRAVQGQTEDSLKALGEAVGLAGEYRGLAQGDPDFDSLRHHAEFQKLVKN